MIVAGQQHGAVAMGISGVLLEEIVYDESGQNRSGSFADYMLATAVEIPLDRGHLAAYAQPPQRRPAARACRRAASWARSAP